MAIFGNLGDIPLPDLLPMLGRRTGVLELWNLEAGQNVSLWLETGQLRGVWLTGKSLEANPARNLVIELLNAKHGSFEFMLGQPKMVCQYPVNWSVERLLSVTFPSGENPAHTQLPDPNTKFQAVALEVWLDEPLYSFWQKARPLLAHGASALEVAQKLSLPVEQVQQYLHRLRLAGRVSPVKAFKVEPSSRERRSLVSRLLAALSLFRRRG